jgi:predicted S18 family serine protease
VDVTGARLLANAWSMAEWAWFWLNASRDAPNEPPVDPRALAEAARLLKAQAKSTAAYLRALLEEAGGNPEAAALAEYLAERAAAERDPVAVIGLAVESISASTTTIHREFTLKTSETASSLAGLAAYLASRGPGGLQSALLLNLASTANDTQTSLAAASKAVLYAWLEARLTGNTLAQTGQSPGQAGMETVNEKTTTPRGTTETPTQTPSSLSPRTMIETLPAREATAGLMGLLLGILVGIALGMRAKPASR